MLGGPHCRKAALAVSFHDYSTPRFNPQLSQAFMLPGLFFLDLNYWSLPASVLALASHEDFTQVSSALPSAGAVDELNLLPDLVPEPLQSHP